MAPTPLSMGIDNIEEREPLISVASQYPAPNYEQKALAAEGGSGRTSECGGRTAHCSMIMSAAPNREPEDLIVYFMNERQPPGVQPRQPLPSPLPPQPPSSPPSKMEVAPLEAYEERLSNARLLAKSVGSLYNLSSFLAFCSLTWATVVLLGAFVPDLRVVDFAMVITLLLLEAVRLASAAFFTVLLTHGIIRQSQNPKHITYDKDDHYHHALIARLISSFLQALFISPSFVCPIIRFPIVQYQHHNLHSSILIFYALILINASISTITLFCSSAAFIYLRDRNDQSLLRYYDEVVQNAISSGVIQSDEFGFFHFAYKMLGGEYARILKPEEVVKNHRKLVAYLYHHRVGQDFLLIYLDAEDAFVQQAAMNMAGFWGDPSKNVGIQKLRIADEVLTKMADNVAIGQVGWAAINSFVGLARRDASILATTRTSNGMPLLDRLAELVIKTSSSRSLPFVRALVLFYHYSFMQEEDGQLQQEQPLTLPMLRQEEALVQKLKELLRWVRVQRVRAYSAYLLHLLGRVDSSCYALMQAINPMQDSYWFKMEEDMFRFLFQKYRLQLPPSPDWPLPEGFVRPDY